MDRFRIEFSYNNFVLNSIKIKLNIREPRPELKFDIKIICQILMNSYKSLMIQCLIYGTKISNQCLVTSKYLKRKKWWTVFYRSQIILQEKSILPMDENL